MINNKGTVPIETDRMILRRLKFQDAYSMYNNWAKDDDVTKYVSWETHKDIKETKGYIQTICENYKDNAFYSWGMELKESGTLIGTISAHNFNENDSSIEIGYCTGKKFWNNGYVTEALKALIKFLFEEVNVNKISAFHIEENTASEKVMKKCGMKYNSDSKETHIIKNNSYIIKGYSILKDDYKNLNS